jgi:dCTP deaminase
LEELASRHAEGGQSWGYSIGENGRLQMALLDAPRFVGRDSLVEITLDDGATIEATPDHEFMRRDGSWTRAGDLEPLDSLMPLYRMSLRGYEMVYQPRTGRYSPTHGLADAWNLRNDVYAALPESQRHHVDQDRRNNNPWNVVRMAAGDHIGHHDARSRSETFDPVDHTESVKDAFRRRSADPGGTLGMRAQQAARARSSWYDETYAARRTVLGCDRSVSRGFPEDLAAQRGARDGSVRATSHPDPKLNHAVTSVRALKGDHDVYCLSVPEAGNFALEAGVFVSNCGIVANVTPLEPGWEGHVTLELSNTTPLPAKVYANEGIVQLLFFQGDRPETTYRDRKGKYQGQKGVTLPRI